MTVFDCFFVRDVFMAVYGLVVNVDGFAHLLVEIGCCWQMLILWSWFWLANLCTWKKSTLKFLRSHHRQVYCTCTTIMYYHYLLLSFGQLAIICPSFSHHLPPLCSPSAMNPTTWQTRRLVGWGVRRFGPKDLERCRPKCKRCCEL